MESAAVKENPQVFVDPLLLPDTCFGSIFSAGYLDVFFFVQTTYSVQPTQKLFRSHPAVCFEHAGHQVHRQGMTIDCVDQRVQYLV